MASPVYHQPSQPEAFQYPSASRSSRSTYPTFLSLQDTVALQAKWVWRGLCDALRWTVVISAVYGDSEIRANIYKSLLLNTLSLTSICTFDLFLHPLVRDQEKWIPRNIGRFYQVLWLMPLVGISYYLNSAWCKAIAKRAFSLKHGPRAAVQPASTYTGILTALATSVYRAVMIVTSVVVSYALSSIPKIGPLASFVFVCWINAYYFFEFIWIARGLSLSRRIRHLEERWAYYFAFGFPSAVICMWGSALASAALFALIYPVYVILAMNALPVPSDPYNPLPPSPESGTVRHPSPFIPIRIPIFAIVIWINDAIVNVLTVGNSRSKGSQRGATFGDVTESIEEGESIELKPASAGTGRRSSGRINIGRRKID